MIAQIHALQKNAQETFNNYVGLILSNVNLPPPSSGQKWTFYILSTLCHMVMTRVSVQLTLPPTHLFLFTQVLNATISVQKSKRMVIHFITSLTVSFQDFLIQLDIKPAMHLVKISIFSIWSKSLKFLSLIFQLISNAPFALYLKRYLIIIR